MSALKAEVTVEAKERNPAPEYQIAIRCGTVFECCGSCPTVNLAVTVLQDVGSVCAASYTPCRIN